MQLGTLLFLITIGVIFLLYLWLIHPSTKRKSQMQPFLEWSYAHRGLHDMKRPDPIPENSMAAFARAVDHGYAIELDVHMTRDRALVVFHDDDLRRMCGINRQIEEMTWDELKGLHLLHTGHTIPKFSDVLQLVNGRVPLLIEIKLPGKDTAICHRVWHELQVYEGAYLIESFQPFVLLWFRKNHPKVLRGQLASQYESSGGMDAVYKWLSSTLLVNTLSRPDFVAYNFRTTDALGFRLNQRLFHAVIFAWTIRTEGEYDSCRRLYDGLIFENCLPNPRRSKPKNRKDKSRASAKTPKK